MQEQQKRPSGPSGPEQDTSKRIPLVIPDIEEITKKLKDAEKKQERPRRKCCCC